MPPDTFSVPAHLLDKLGLSLERLCARAGVAPTNAWRTDDFFRLWAALDEELVDRAAGLRFGAEGISRGYGVAAIVALHAPDFRRALEALSRYKRLTCPELVEIEPVGDDVVVRYRWLQADGDVPRLLIDTTMASLKELARQGTSGQVLPIRLELARRAKDGPLLRRHFGCPIVFGAEHNAMVFPRASLAVPFTTADGGAFARVLAGLEQALVDGQGFAPLVGRVRVAIAQQLGTGLSPAAAAVARRLATSSRTLQRRLAEGGTCFQEQLAAVRRTIAGRLLAHTDLDTIAIAMLLGFEEPNSFARAFRAWEQTTPRRWRERHAAAPGLRPA
ncbi:AraC family transcriptional regulator [Mitsuaria sp. 7]|uniref:AraC family transcriptional regulator n=1 Tax=Mitsuaria sp. 7 TaxID=1658665 RepID=UPI000834C226|nr:AraC family transcriptional regulator [Mitsuaria sp. 7]